MKKTIYEDIVSRGVATNEPTSENVIDNSGASSMTNYNDYINQIKMNKMNARSELASAQEKSNVLMNNYLKALGVQGSGLGQSAIAQNNLNYAKMQNQSDKSYDDQLLQYKEQQQDKYGQMAKDLVASGVSSETYQNFLNNYSDVLGYQDYYKALGGDLESEKDMVLNSINTDLEGSDNLVNASKSNAFAPVYLQSYKDIIYNSDVDSDEYKKAVEAYNRLIEGQDVTELNKQLGVGKEIQDKINSNPLLNAIKNKGAKDKEGLKVGTSVKDNDELYVAYKSTKSRQQNPSDEIVVNYNGKKYTINSKTDKIVSIQ